MKKYGIYYILLLSWCFIYPMQKQKPPADLLTGAAAFNNIQGVEKNLRSTNPNTPDSQGRTAIVEAAKKGYLQIVQLLVSNGAIIDQPDQKGFTALGQAAKNGYEDVVKYLMDMLFAQNKQQQINQKDSSGLTPLMWATLALDKSKQQDYQRIVSLFMSAVTQPHSLNFRDNNGLTPAHTAASGGNSTILDLILNNARAFSRTDLVNDQGSEKKGRTPLAEAIRASKDGIIHIDLEHQNFASPDAYYAALQEPKKGIEQLLFKEQNKLSTQQLINQINVLKKYGANPNIPDATGRTLDYYINDVLLVSEQDRIALLQALGLPIIPRIIKYTPNDLLTAAQQLIKIEQLAKQYNIGQSLQLALWTVTRALQEQNTTNKFNLLRIAMGMLATAKEQAKEKMKDPNGYAKFEYDLNMVRDIIRDAALVAIGKATPTQAPAQPIVTPPTTPTLPQQTQITPAMPQALIYALYFVNQTGEEPFLVTVIDKYNFIVLKQEIGIGQETQILKTPASSLPLTLNVQSKNNLVSGSIPLTAERLHQELQKIGIQVPQNYHGEIAMIFFIYKDRFTVKGLLTP